MRWLWVDRFEEFVGGQYAVSVKNVCLAEEPVDDYCPGYPFLSPTLMIEGMAQTAGLLFHQCFDFEERVVLAKIGHCHFDFEVIPGDTIRYRCEFSSRSDTGAMFDCTAHVGDRKLADVELMFAKLEDKRFDDVVLFGPAQFCRMIRLMKLFDVAVDGEGRPIPVPQHMLDAERAILINFPA